ncbi:MAG: AMP-binding protein [Pseudonocardia sp.]
MIGDVLRAVADGITGNLRALAVLVRSGVVAPVRPDRLAWMAVGAARYGFTLAGGYTAGAARHPDRTAIVDDLGRLSYAEVARRSDDLARGLAARGVSAGDRLGVLCRNHRWAVEAQVAAGKLGADVVLLNTGLSAAQLRDVAVEQRLAVLVADPEFEVPDGLDTVRTGDDVEALIAAAGDATLPLRPAAAHTIVLTSGTTGTPKGARRPAPRSMSPIGAIGSAIPLRAGEPVLLAAPVLHAWGLAGLQLAMLHGAPVVLSRRFDPATMLELAERERCDAVIAVPVMLQRVLELPAATLDAAWRSHRPRVVAVSGSALPAGLATAFMDRFGDVLHNLYGSTEVSWVSIAGPADLRAAPRTAGRAPAGTRLVVLGDDDRAAPTGAEGRIFVGNDMPFDGYTREGADVARHGDLIGTGDVGHLDADGRLHLTGRADDMIVSGGENVHPGPVEDLIAARPDVREVAVVGVPDEEYGQRLAAYVVPEPGATIDADDVRGRVRGELGRFAVPRDVVVLDELPRNATGKVAREDLPDVGTTPT